MAKRKDYPPIGIHEMNDIIASVELEGLKFTPEEKIVLEKVATGEITLEEYKRQIDESLAQDRIDHPEWFIPVKRAKR